ncbi:TolC family protein [Mucilaginibacter ginkgonis]|uniref:TolC family protein n=2 Tax=Mucilaginibacter ginkgonis TaxID=2682091 RepID=A0A6I4HYQ1_9SPHI|nr:TolC family protein [Mucilaginibacter ginkgonis]
MAQTPPPAAPTHSFTLADCIAYALQHQDTVINANLDIKSAQYRVKEVTGQGLPQLTASASLLDYLKIPTTLLPGEFFGAPGTFIPVKFGVKYQSNFGVDASQLLFDGTFFIGLKASKTYQELSQKSLTRSKIQANVNVTKAYYSVLVNDERVKLLDANIKQLKTQLDQTTAQNKQGFVEKIDVDRTTVQYNTLVSNRENALRLLAVGYQMLKFQMGMPIQENLILLDKLEDVKLDETAAAQTTDTTLYKNRIEYSLLETQYRLNQLDVKRNQANYFPKLSAIGNFTSAYQDNAFGNLYANQFPSSYIGLRLSWQVFTGFQHKYQVAQSKITVQKTQNDMENAKNGFALQAEYARINYINGLQTLNSQRRNRDLAQEVLRVSKIKYQQGVGSSIEVTQAETALVDADDKYIQGLYDALVNKVELDRTYGRIQY